MAITSWIDKIAAVWATVEDGKGGFVRSYKSFEKAEFPDALNTFPCVLTYVTSLPSVQYSAGGVNKAVWRGISEFHVVSNNLKSNYPYLMGFYDRIIKAAAANYQLGGAVDHFVLVNPDAIRPGVLSYGTEDSHLGLIVNWEVKENLTVSFSV